MTPIGRVKEYRVSNTVELFSVHLPPQRIAPSKKHIHFNDFTNCPLSFNPISSGIVLFSRLLIRNIFSRWCLKGTVQWDFGPLVFLHNLTTDEWIKYFLFLVKKSLSYSNLSISPGCDTPASQSPKSMIPHQVNFPGVSYPSESIKNPPKQGIIPITQSLFSGYHTSATQFF